MNTITKVMEVIGVLAFMLFAGTLGYNLGRTSRNQEVSVYREQVVNEMLESVTYREVAIKVTMKLHPNLEREAAEILVDDNLKFIPIIRQQLKAEGKL